MNQHNRTTYTSNPLFNELNKTLYVPPGHQKWSRIVRIASFVVCSTVGYYWVFLKDFGYDDHVFVPVHRAHDKFVSWLGFTPPNRNSNSDPSYGIWGKGKPIPPNTPGYRPKQQEREQGQAENDSVAHQDSSVVLGNSNSN